MSSISTRPASGTQFVIESGDYRAEIASVGASLRSLTHGGRHLVVPFDAGEIRPGYRGANLVPWPNRIADGTYTFNGERQQLSINEVERMTALHGLAIWNDWEVAAQSPSSVTLGAVIEPQEGYPHRLAVQVGYSLSTEGLTWNISALNVGSGADSKPAPYGVAPHPYLVAGEGTVDEWTLHLPAQQVLAVTADRLLPTTVETVDTHRGGYFDFQQARPLGATEIDHAYTALTAEEADGEVEVQLLTREGTGVRMRWTPGNLPWVQIHTADRPAPHPSRIGLAVEPMSCPPDAFNSGEDLVVLALGERHSAQWLIGAL
ncbi:MAG: aldose-1-epimerase [Specibacter sp.]